jgi:cytoskeleton protein RodZ
VDSATRLNAGRVSPRGADRGGHVHRVDVPKTPAQGGDRDVLSADESPVAAADVAGVEDDRGGQPEAEAEAEVEAGSTADLTGPELVGRRLMLARRHAGLSVEEVAANTRIRGTMIRQIEAGDFSRCGGEVYARGHVRAIAKAVGADGAALLGGQAVLVVAEQAAPRPSVSAPMSPPQPKAKAKETKGRQSARGARVIRPAKAAIGSGSASAAALPAVIEPRRLEKAGVIGQQSKSPNWTAAMLVALLGLVVFGGMQLIGGDNSTPAAAAHVPPPAPKPAAAPAPAPAPPPAPTGVAVKIAANGSDSWLAVFGSDGHKLYDNLLPAGSSQTFKDGHKLDVTVGNAAAIRMQLNGKDVAPSGGAGEVVHFAVNPTGVVAG